MSILDKMNFNPYAFVAPKTPQEYSALLDEGMRLMDDLNENLDGVFKHLEEQKKNPPKED